jgi:adenylate cyclase
MAQRAVEIDAKDFGAHPALRFVLLNDRRWEEAEFHYEAAIRLNPNNADALVSIVDLQYLTSRRQDALQTAAKALRLNPRQPGWYYWIVGIAQVVASQCENAVATLSREETYGTASRDILVAALALLGRTAEAYAEARPLLATNPHWRISEWAANEAFKNPTDAKRWIEAVSPAYLSEAIAVLLAKSV